MDDERWQVVRVRKTGKIFVSPLDDLSPVRMRNEPADVLAEGDFDACWAASRLLRYSAGGLG